MQVNNGNGDVDGGALLADSTTAVEKSTVKPKIVVQKAAKTTVATGKWLLQGSYLPMFSDKVRNSVKSRLVLVLCYILAASIVAGFVVANFYVREVRRYSIEFLVPPQSTFDIGTAFSPFSIQVVDQHNNGLSGSPVFVTMVPIDDVTLEVSIGDVVFPVDDFRCVSTMVFPFTAEFNYKVPFCSPQTAAQPTYPLLTNRMTQTDGRGIGRFVNTTLLLGVRGTYLIVVGVLDCPNGMNSCQAIPDLFVTAYVNTAPQVLTMSVTKMNLPIFNSDGSLVRQYNLTVVGMPQGADASASDEWLRQRSGISAEVNVTFLSSSAPQGVTGMILPLKLLNSPRPKSVVVPFMPADTVRPTGTIGNGYSTTTNITMIAPGVYQATLRFENIVVISTNTKRLFLGCYVLGRLVPLTPPQLTSTIQTPTTFLLPFSTNSPVATVTIVSNPTTLTNGAVQEGDLLQFVVRVTDAFGIPVPLRSVYMELTPSSGNPPARFNEVDVHPERDPKVLIFSETFTDETGTAHFLGTRTSVSHAPGLYNIRITCDGVSAVVGGSTLIPIRVTSKIASAVLKAPPTPQVETVGAEWIVVPSVLIADSNGAPIPGKRAVMRPVDANAVGVVATASPSGMDGISNFYTVKVYFTTQTTATFEVLVDGIVVGQFSRMLQHTSARIPGVNTNTTFAKLLAVPPQPTYSGIAYQIQLSCVDEFGVPSPCYSVNVEVSSKYLPAPPGQTATNFPTDCGLQSVCTFSTSFGPTLDHTSLVGYFSTPSMVVKLPLMVTFISRVLSVDAGFVIEDKMPYITVDINAIWSAVSATYPLAVNAFPVWQPSYVRQYVSTDAPLSTTKFINSTQRVKIGIENLATLAPGLYVYAPAVSFGEYDPISGKFGAGIFSIYLPVVPLYVPSSATRLEIVVSAFNGSLAVGQPFSVQPRVRVFSTDGITPRGGVRIIAQMGVRLGPLLNRYTHWLDTSKNPQDIVYGQLRNLSNPQNTLVEAVSQRSDNNTGDAQFRGIGFLGAYPAAEVVLRYCAFINKFNPYASTADSIVESLCVEEVQSYFIPIADASGVVVSPLRISTTPGAVLPPFTIKQFNKFNSYVTQPMGGAQCTAAMFNTPPNYLLYTEQFTTSLKTSVANPGSNTVTTDNMLLFSDFTPDGTYFIQFFCVGAISPLVQVTVTSIPGSIEFSVPPPQDMTIDRQVGMQVTLYATSGTPLIGGLQFSIQPSGKANEDCEREACGVLTAGSTAFQKTDANGNALFQFAMSSAAAGPYEITVGVAPIISPQGTLQSVQDDIAVIQGMFGVPRDSLVSYVKDTTLIPGAEQFNDLAKSTMLEILSITYSISDMSAAAAATSPKAGEDDDSNFLERFFSRRKPVIAKTTVNVPNPVAKCVITKSITRNIEMPPPPAVTTPITTVPPFITVTFDSDDAPRLSLRNSTGGWVRGTNITTVTVLPQGGDGSLVSLNSDQWTADEATEEIVLTGLQLKFSAPGKYQLAFSSRGGGMNVTAKFEVKQGTGKTLSEVMKEASFVVFAVFTPLLIATVPHVHPLFMGLGLLLSVGVIVAASVIGAEYLQYLENRYVYGYCVLLILLAIVTGVLQQIVTIIDFVGRYTSKYAWRIVNDEHRAFKIFEYARWITNVRIEKQQEQIKAKGPKKSIKAKALRAKDSLQEAQAGMIDRVARTVSEVNKRLDVEMFDIDTGVEKEARVRRFNDRPPLKYSSKIDATFTPINFIVVCGITTVLTALITFLMIYAYNYVLDYVSGFMEYLPQAQDMNKVSLVNGLAVWVVRQGLDAIATTFPEYGFLANWGAKLQGTNVLLFLANLRNFVQDCIDRLTVAFYIAVTFADLAVIACMISIAYVIPGMIQDIRRGIVKRSGSAGSGEPYIGLHCFHFVMMHQLIVWPLVITVLMISVAPIRVFLWNQLQVILIASVSSVVIQFVLSNLLVGWLLTDEWRILRPEFYSLWHFVALILGVFTGIVKSIVRYVQAMVFITLLFPRLDFTIFPVLFSSFDLGHNGFYSVIVVEAKNNNPIGLIFSAWLLLEHKCRELADRYEGPLGAVDIDTFGEQRGRCNEPMISSAIMKNLIRIQLRSLVDGNSLLLNEAPATPSIDLSRFDDTNGRRSRLELVRNRWWLLWILHQNPSLGKYRKHYMYLHRDEVAQLSNMDKVAGVVNDLVSAGAGEYTAMV